MTDEQHGTPPQTSEGEGKNTGGNTGTPPAGSSGGTPPKVTFTSEQQEAVNDLIKRRLDQARASWDEQTQKDKAEADRKASEERAKAQGEFQTLAEQRATRIAELEGQITNLTTGHRTQLTQLYVELEANKQHALDSSDVWALIDKSALTYGDDGKPTNVAEVVTKLLEAKPHLVNGQRPSGGIPNTPRPSATTVDAARQQAEESLRKSSRYRL